MGISGEMLWYLLLSASRTTNLMIYGIKHLRKPTTLVAGDPGYSSIVHITLHLRV